MCADHPDDRPEVDGLQRRADLVGAELRRRGVHRVRDVLDDLEPQADERPDHEAVEGGADDSSSERQEQHQAESLGELLGERRGQARRPVEPPCLAEGLRVQRPDRLVGRRGHRPGGAEAAPDERGDGRLRGLARVAVDARGEPPEERAVQSEHDARGDDRLTVCAEGVGEAPDLGHRADRDHDEVHPERQVARLHEVRPQAPASPFDGPCAAHEQAISAGCRGHCAPPVRPECCRSCRRYHGSFGR